jgi:branched-chain amino acid transport system permease protein
MMIFFFQILLNGIATGAIYALIAVGYSVTFTTMRVLNFGLGMWVMLGGMMTYSLYAVWGLNIVVTMIVIVAILGLLGVVAERVTVRPFVKAGSEAWVMATLAVGLLFVDVAELIWGRNSLAVPAFVGQEVLRFGPFGVYPQQLLIIAATIAAFLALDYFYYRTLWGKAFRAVAHNPEVARLMGVDAGAIATASYAMACVLGGLAGMLVVPITLADPQMGTVLGLKAFVIPIVAGLASPRGILVCGIAYGVIEGLISGYLFSSIRDILAFAIMIAVLYCRPEGLFGRPTAERA